jgi:hypothetical protein
MATTTIRMDRRLTYKQQLALSEQRNLGLAKYLKEIEDRCKNILVAVSNKYDELNIILTPESQEFRKLLADICVWLAPICTDVEDMQLPPEAIARLVEDGGQVVRINEQPATPAEGGDDGRQNSVQTETGVGSPA